MSRQRKTPVPVAAGKSGVIAIPSQKNIAKATLTTSPQKRKRYVRSFVIHWSTGVTQQLTLAGQTARTLETLIQAGPDGITALEVSSWAMRLAVYIGQLRHDHSLVIDMLRESHSSEYSQGKHGRYFLKTKVLVSG
jgi:hypothetical protein